MASNFEITVDKSSDRFGLKLAGDFDGTSAYELIYAIKKFPKDIRQLHIYTNDLKKIHPFGLDVFYAIMGSLNGQSTNIIFDGKYALQLSNSRLVSERQFKQAQPEHSICRFSGSAKKPTLREPCIDRQKSIYDTDSEAPI